MEILIHSKETFRGKCKNRWEMGQVRSAYRDIIGIEKKCQYKQEVRGSFRHKIVNVFASLDSLSMYSECYRLTVTGVSVNRTGLYFEMA